MATASADTTAAGIDRLRDTAKWLIGAYAAVGAAVIAGLGLASVGKIEDEARLWLALSTAFVALAAVAVAIWKVTNVLGPVKVEHADLAEDSPADKMAKATDSLLKGQARSLSELQTLYTTALTDYQAKRKEAREDSTKEPDAERAYREVLALNDPLSELRRIALFEKLKAIFDSTKWWLFGTAVVAAGCIVAFAWAANPSDESQANAKAKEDGPTIVRPALVTIAVDHRRHSLSVLRDTLGSGCDLDHIHAVVAGGTSAEPELITLPKDHCRNARFTLTPDIGVTYPVVE